MSSSRKQTFNHDQLSAIVQLRRSWPELHATSLSRFGHLQQATSPSVKYLTTKSHSKGPLHGLTLRWLDNSREVQRSADIFRCNHLDLGSSWLSGPCLAQRCRDRLIIPAASKSVPGLITATLFNTVTTKQVSDFVDGAWVQLTWYLGASCSDESSLSSLSSLHPPLFRL